MSRRGVQAAALASAALVAGLVAGPASPGAAGTGTTRLTEYVVLVEDGASMAAAEAAVAHTGATVVARNADAGTLLVRSDAAGFITMVSGSAAVAGAARNRSIGHVPETRAPRRKMSEMPSARMKAALSGRKAPSAQKSGVDPLSSLQWDMRMIGATADGSYANERGDPDVLVGIMDTGIDGSHPDIKPNFNRSLSRNFTTDIPAVDGPCEYTNCKDPADVDHNSHGTHVASEIGAPINGIGIAGVAPDISLVNLRAGQDSGFFFLQPAVDALTYAGRHGIDVINMSFFIDPWLYNCRDNPADSPAAQIEQRTIIRATQRALDFADEHGVTLVSAEGNEGTDIGNPEIDVISPDYPPGSEYERQVDNSCLTMPTEGRHAVGVSAVGPSKRKAFYSNYGTEQTDVAAPGGDIFDSLDNTVRVESLILGAYVESVALELGDITEPNGEPTNPFVLRECSASDCWYYAWFMGTSMSSPHATGVASLVISRLGGSDNGGLTLDPDTTREALYDTATKTACPDPRDFEYVLVFPDGSQESFVHTCEGPRAKNGFYGRGIVDAEAASQLRD